ncbi:MAG: ABC transporter substrate-binding protein [Rhodobiaceae bacterium]|nr:ABC transporter substrate-binding protein [Rhodobiaceae bacterium]MCC0054577.1 ABC transporter substrate-binding protein [Rhodobiaceae bacterium]
MALNKLRIIGAAAAAAFTLSAGIAQAEQVKLGYGSDLTGASSVLGGESSVTAIKMAIEDMGGELLGQPIELLISDTLNKPDVGLGLARKWIDEDHVTALLDFNNSAIALAVTELAAEKNVIYMSGGSTTKLTNEQCHETTSQWIPSSYSLARSVTVPLVKQGADNWFFITVDYAFGHDLEAKAIEAVEGAGGKVVGSVRFSPQTTDYSAFLLEAQSKGAKTIGLVSFGSYMINTIKQANEFGMDVRLVPFYMALTDIKSVGLETLKNVSGATLFYWGRNDKTKAFSKRFEERYGRPATFHNAMMYSEALHYMKAVKAAGTTEAKAVAAKMREMPIDDATDTSAIVRLDGRVARDMYVFDVKKKEESTSEWDVMKIVATGNKDDLEQKLSESTCALLKK